MRTIGTTQFSRAPRASRRRQAAYRAPGVTAVCAVLVASRRRRKGAPSRHPRQPSAESTRHCALAMDLDLDLSSLGLRSSKERTLGALKRAAAAAPAPRPAYGSNPGLGAPSAPPPLPPHLPPPSPHLAAGLDALASFGSPMPAPARPVGQARAPVEDLLGDLLSTPMASVRCASARHAQLACAGKPARCAHGYGPRCGGPECACQRVLPYAVDSPRALARTSHAALTRPPHACFACARRAGRRTAPAGRRLWAPASAALGLLAPRPHLAWAKRT